jgi:flap endonuclease-1
MGIASLRELLDPQRVELGHFAKKTVAVDADNLLWSFVTAFGAKGEQPMGPAGQPVGHLIGLTGRLKLYAQYNIRSAWVFDGPQPKLKEATTRERAERIAANDSIELTRAQIEDAKALLRALGIPWMVAPCESDPQCAALVKSGVAYAAVTQDYDIALHGAPRAGRNLTGSKTRRPELLDLQVSLAACGLTQAQLIDAAILIGTDYNTGVVGVGPIKAVKLMQKHGDLATALAALGQTIPLMSEVRDLFLAHPVDARWRPTWRQPNAAKAGDILDAAGLGRARVEGLAKSIAPDPQTGLGEF